MIYLAATVFPAPLSPLRNRHRRELLHFISHLTDRIQMKQEHDICLLLFELFSTFEADMLKALSALMDNLQFLAAKVGKKSLRLTASNSWNNVSLAFNFQTL